MHLALGEIPAHGIPTRDKIPTPPARLAAQNTCIRLHPLGGSGMNEGVAERLDSAVFLSPFKALAPT
jgi:hypothetical protein